MNDFKFEPVYHVKKYFEEYILNYVFELNNTDNRNTITKELQDLGDKLINNIPEGTVSNIKVICDETNNTNDIIESNELHVDVVFTYDNNTVSNMCLILSPQGVSFNEKDSTNR